MKKIIYCDVLRKELKPIYCPIKKCNSCRKRDLPYSPDEILKSLKKNKGPTPLINLLIDIGDNGADLYYILNDVLANCDPLTDNYSKYLKQSQENIIKYRAPIRIIKNATKLICDLPPLIAPSMEGFNEQLQETKQSLKQTIETYLDIKYPSQKYRDSLKNEKPPSKRNITNILIKLVDHLKNIDNPSNNTLDFKPLYSNYMTYKITAELLNYRYPELFKDKKIKYDFDNVRLTYNYHTKQKKKS